MGQLAFIRENCDGEEDAVEEATGKIKLHDKI
jgi:hypothetical protein